VRSRPALAPPPKNVTPVRRSRRFRSVAPVRGATEVQKRRPREHQQLLRVIHGSTLIVGRHLTSAKRVVNSGREPSIELNRSKIVAVTSAPLVVADVVGFRQARDVVFVCQPAGVYGPFSFSRVSRMTHSELWEPPMSNATLSSRSGDLMPTCVGVPRDSHGRIERSEKAKDDFKKQHPCPSTGKSSGSCPGYVIDHVTPLERGGVDDPSNMQWQTTADAKAKDKVE
jgi:hypothetical protein